MISFYTFLIRLSCYKEERPIPKDIHTLQCYFNNSLIEDYRGMSYALRGGWLEALVNREYVFGNSTGWWDGVREISSMNFHNHGGFQTFSSWGTGSAAWYPRKNIFNKKD